MPGQEKDLKKSSHAHINTEEFSLLYRLHLKTLVLLRVFMASKHAKHSDKIKTHSFSLRRKSLLQVSLCCLVQGAGGSTVRERHVLSCSRGHGHTKSKINTTIHGLLKCRAHMCCTHKKKNTPYVPRKTLFWYVALHTCTSFSLCGWLVQPVYILYLIQNHEVWNWMYERCDVAWKSHKMRPPR